MIDMRLVSILRRQEGKRNDVYRDSEGYFTIGYGYLISRDRSITEAQARDMCNAPWTDAECDDHLLEAIEDTTRAVDYAFPWASMLPEWPRRGLIDMAYQLGIQGVKGFPRMLKALQDGDYAEAKRHALDSMGTPENPGWHRQTPSRCNEVAAMIGNQAIV